MKKVIPKQLHTPTNQGDLFLSDIKNHMSILVEGVNDNIALLADGLLMANEKIDRVHSELTEFKTEMYQFCNETILKLHRLKKGQTALRQDIKPIRKDIQLLQQEVFM